jgi:hypothetical protein
VKPERLDHDGQKVARSIFEIGSGDRRQIEKVERASSHQIGVVRRGRRPAHCWPKLREKGGKFCLRPVACEFVIRISAAQALDSRRCEAPCVGRALLRTQAEQCDGDTAQLVGEQVLQGGATKRMTFVSEPQAPLGASGSTSSASYASAFWRTSKA